MTTTTASVRYAEGTASMQPDPEARHVDGAASVSSHHRFPIESARCAATPDTHDWVPDRERRVVPAPLASLCRRCPGRQNCLAWALAGGEAGYWAGTTSKDRRQLAAPDLTAADALQRQQRQSVAVGRGPVLHAPGQASYGWYRKGCPCQGCREANNTQRAGERARARQRRDALLAA